MCGRKGPVARTRGRRRHPRKLGGTPPRSPGGARAAEETAYPLAPRSPRGSRWGRWSEGVLTRPKPQAARYPAGCPPLSAAKCGEAEEACPNVSRGFGGMCHPSLQAKRRGGSQAAPLRPLSAGVGSAGEPGDPAISAAILRRGPPLAAPRPADQRSGRQGCLRRCRRAGWGGGPRGALAGQRR